MLRRGTAPVPGATDANPTVDSRERFYSAIFAGYGIAWMRAVRKYPIRANDVRLLAEVWWLTAIGNSGAMTPYLWHIPALPGVHLVFDYLGYCRYPGQPHLVPLSVVQLLLMAISRPPPRWCR